MILRDKRVISYSQEDLITPTAKYNKSCNDTFAILLMQVKNLNAGCKKEIMAAVSHHLNDITSNLFSLNVRNKVF